MAFPLCFLHLSFSPFLSSFISLSPCYTSCVSANDRKKNAPHSCFLIVGSFSPRTVALPSARALAPPPFPVTTPVPSTSEPTTCPQYPGTPRLATLIYPLQPDKTSSERLRELFLAAIDEVAMVIGKVAVRVPGGSGVSKRDYKEEVQNRKKRIDNWTKKI